MTQTVWQVVPQARCGLSRCKQSALFIRLPVYDVFEPTYAQLSGIAQSALITRQKIRAPQSGRGVYWR